MPILDGIVTVIVQYTSMGAPVFPLVPHEKTPDTPRGFKDATLDGSIFGPKWDRGDNLGVATGHAFDAIDLDGPKAILGFAKLVAQELGKPEPTTTDEAYAVLLSIGPVVLTGHGVQVYCIPDPTRTCQTKLLDFEGDAVDYRGIGGYVVAPPSIHPCGKPYRFLNGLSKPLLQAPACLPKRRQQAYDFAKPVQPAELPPSSGSEHPDSYFETVLAVNCQRIREHQESGWHAQILASAQKVGQVLDGRQDRYAQAVDALLEAAAPRTRSDERNARQTIEDGLGWGGQNPHVMVDQPPPVKRTPSKQPQPEDFDDGDPAPRAKRMTAAAQVSEVVRILHEEPEYAGLLAYDTWSDRIKKTRALGTDPDDRARASYWEDTDTFRLQKQINDRYGYDIADTAMAKAIDLAAHDNSFDPVRDYLAKCEAEWDGQSRVEGILDALGAEVNKPQKLSMALWLAGAAARGSAYDEVKFDSMIILESRQGFGKSSFVKILGGDYAGDSAIDLEHPREAYQQLSAAWIHELAELTSVLRSSSDAVKAFITKTSDDFRKPYGRQISHRVRRCVFVGTTNEDDYLRDETGNRRFWPVACGVTRQQLGFTWLRENRDQIWGEAMVLMRHYSSREMGISPTLAEARMLADYASTRQQADELRDAICSSVRQAYDRSTCTDVDITPDEVMQDQAVAALMESYRGNRRNTVRKIMLQLGGEAVRLDIKKPTSGFDFSNEADKRRRVRTIRFTEMPAYRGDYDDGDYPEVVLPTERRD